MRARHPLALVGAKGWLNADLERHLAPLERTGQLRRLGYVPQSDLHALYAGAHAFAYPSLYEGFGLPLLEAMASGVPALSSNCSSLPEVAGDAALLIDPEDLDALTTGLERLLGDDPWRASARARGLEHARSFSWEHCVEETVAVYRRLRGNPRMTDRYAAVHAPEESAGNTMLEYDSARRPPPFVDEFVQLLRYRDLVLLMAGNILKNRYKRSMLGILWMLLNPLLQTIVLAVAFGSLFKSALPHYPIYLLSGLLAWSFMTQTTQYAMGVMAGGGGLLKRIYIPRATYVVAVVGNGLINFLVSVLPLALVVLVFQHPVSASWLFLPISILILAVFTLGLALLLSTASVFFTDSIDIYQIVVQAGFFLTPIMYPPSVLPDSLSGWLILNPFFLLIELFRAPIYANTIPDADLIACAATLALATLLAGWTVFTQKADQLAYRL